MLYSHRFYSRFITICFYLFRCWDLIDAQAEMALKSEGFLEIDFNTLESILSRDTLNVKEETAVFDAALRC